MTKENSLTVCHNLKTGDQIIFEEHICTVLDTYPDRVNLGLGSFSKCFSWEQLQGCTILEFQNKE